MQQGQTMPYAERESLLLAPYAMRAADSAGRRVPEPEHPYRSPYQRDRDRITHSAAYRRLSYKTQVFTHELGQSGQRGEADELGDYHRTRLTHTHEVASVARTVARALRLNEDLVEALALAHDVGHPPFGHAGEAVLNDLLRDAGGFNHNRQAVRIFERLEQRYADRAGLNLTAEVLQGQQARDNKSRFGADRDGRLLETQVVDAADSIAYDAHDADDALELGLLTLGDLDSVPLWRETAARVGERCVALSEGDLRRSTIHELLDRQVNDLLSETRSIMARQQIESVEAVRASGTLIKHSAELAEQKLELERFLFERVYRHSLVLKHRTQATEALESLFEACLDQFDALPAPYQAVVAEESPRRAVADYVASLTDRAALRDAATLLVRNSDA